MTWAKLLLRLHGRRTAICAGLGAVIALASIPVVFVVCSALLFARPLPGREASEHADAQKRTSSEKLAAGALVRILLAVLATALGWMIATSALRLH